VTIANLAVGSALPQLQFGGVVQEVRDSTDLQSMGIPIEMGAGNDGGWAAGL